MFQGNSFTIFQRSLYDIHVIRVRQFDNLKFVLPLHVVNPFVRLTLRIDEQAPPLRVVHDNGVLGGERVSRQAEYVPRIDLYLGAEHLDEIVISRARYVQAVHVVDPFSQTLDAIVGREWAQVRYHAAGDQNISRQRVVGALQVRRRLCPTILLSSQAADQFLGPNQLVPAVGHLNEIAISVSPARFSICVSACLSPRFPARSSWPGLPANVR